MRPYLKIIVLLISFVCSIGITTKAQLLMDMVDTTTEMGRGMLSMYKNLDGVKISGYLQPQFQLASEEGVQSFEGGNFNTNNRERIMLRRSRVRIDYVHFESGNQPRVQVVFQFDANERGFTVRDIWGRVSENNLKLFSLTTGMFARPFGYEINLSSSERETPERGRMSQTLMKGERDLGVMLSLDSRKNVKWLKTFVLQAGLFNGQGINATGDYDDKKDFIARINLRPIKLSQKSNLTGGISLLRGGLINNTKYVSFTRQGMVTTDSSVTNIDGVSPRQYTGADVQLYMEILKNVKTKLRAEYVYGTQSASFYSSETPNVQPTGRNGYVQRKFNGAYFYIIQEIADKHQVVLKYDWYDANRDVHGKNIIASKGFTDADLRYDTWTMGYNYIMNKNIRLMLHYALVRNERTAIAGFDKERKDNVFTCRLQFRF